MAGPADADSLIFINDSTDYISDNPLLFRLFLPATLYNSAIDRSIYPYEEADTAYSGDLLPVRKLGADDDSITAIIDDALMRLYLEHPELVRMTESELQSVKSFVRVNDSLVSGLKPLDTSISSQSVPEDKSQETHRVKQRYWKTFGNFQGKYTESYYSSNWYKGGESNHSVLAQVNLEADYAKKTTTLDNKLEMKLGFYTTGPKESREIRSNDDLLRFTSKFGLKAKDSWYYSAQFQGYTQFLPVFDQNVKTKLKSKFFAPVYGNLSLGMDYKPKFKKLTLSIMLSPFSYNCRYVSVDSIATNFGIEKGKNFKYSMGSRFDGNLKYTFLTNFTLNTKASFYTSYESVEFNLENTLDYKLSKYFTLQLFMHWRFDDSVKRNEDWGYHQYKELLTLNFNYAW